VIDLYAVGQVTNASPAGVCVSYYDDLMSTINKLLRPISVKAFSSVRSSVVPSISDIYGSQRLLTWVNRMRPPIVAIEYV
jgi:hypothetical protein